MTGMEYEDSEAAGGTRPHRARRQKPPSPRVRMTSAQRREQLIEVSRSLFAANGFEGTSVEEIAARAQVSKPVVYEHFGGKEGLYAVVVDRESQALLGRIRSALLIPGAGFRELIERGALALLDYIDEQPDGFRILVRDSPTGMQGGSFASILSDIVLNVEDIIGEPFARLGHDPHFSGLYAQALTGLVAMAGQSWLDERQPPKEVVAAHLVNLAWNGMGNLQTEPTLRTRPRLEAANHTPTRARRPRTNRG